MLDLAIGSRSEMVRSPLGKAHAGIGRHLLAVDLFPSLRISHNEPDTWRRGDRSTILILQLASRPRRTFCQLIAKTTRINLPCRQNHTSAHVVAVAQRQGYRGNRVNLRQHAWHDIGTNSSHTVSRMRAESSVDRERPKATARLKFTGGVTSPVCPA